MREAIVSALLSIKKPIKRWVIILFMLMFAFLLFPIIDANVFHYSRVNRRAETLSTLVNLDIDTISDDIDDVSILRQEYEFILISISEQRPRAIGNLFSNNFSENPNQHLYSFFIGAAIPIIALHILLLMMYTTNKITLKKPWYIIPLIVILLVMAVAMGIFLAIYAPRFNNPWFAYIGFNILVLALIVMEEMRHQKKAKRPKKFKRKVIKEIQNWAPPE